MFIKKTEAPWIRFVIDPEDGSAGAPEALEDAAAVDEDATIEPEEDDEPLGPEGARALAAEKEKRRDARAELRAAKARIAELEAPKEGEQTPEQIRAEIERDVSNSYRDRVIKAEVKAAAAASFADPEDAITFLSMNDFDVAEDGTVDPADIEDALESLLSRKPHLAKQDTAQSGSKKRVPEVPADPAGGTREPVSLDEQIASAEKSGDWRQVLHLQNQKLVDNK